MTIKTMSHDDTGDYRPEETFFVILEVRAASKWLVIDFFVVIVTSYDALMELLG